MKLFWLLVALCLAVTAAAQVPDVQVKADVLLHYHSEKHGSTTLKWYDSFGHYSTVAFMLSLEPGLKGYVSQRIQRIAHDPDNSPFDEYYVEDTGSWRVGKQYLPFGDLNLIRESVLAVRIEHLFTLNDVPFAIAACDGGVDRQQGVVGRIGSDSLGVSFFIGKHFGISGSSLTFVRQPEDSPGAGEGYKQAVGVHLQQRLGYFRFSGEAVALRRAMSPEAGDRNLVDLSAAFQASPSQNFTVGWTRATGPNVELFRIQNSTQVAQNAFLESFVRLREGRFYDFGASIRIKL